MIIFPQNPTTITTINEGDRQLWRIEHPAMDGAMKVDARRPSDLTGASAARLREGQRRMDGGIGSAIIAALVEQCGVPDGRAESIVDAWEAHARGDDPTSLEEAGANTNG